MMIRFKLTKIQRILLMIALGQAIILGAGSLIVDRNNKELLRDVFSSRAEFAANTIGAAYGTLYCQGKAEEAAKLLKTYYSQGAFAFAQISLSNKILTSIGNVEFNKVSDQDIATYNSALEKSKVFATFAEITPCKFGDEPGEIEIGFSFEGLNTPLKKQMINQAKILLAQIALMFIAMVILSGIFKNQIDLIIARCKKIAQGDLEEVQLFNQKDDFYLISETLNSMSHSLNDLQKEKEVQRAQLVSSSKLSSLGEMAGGIAHEINNPLAVIDGKVYQLKTLLAKDPINPEAINKSLITIENMVQRISKIIGGLRSFSRDGSSDPYEKAQLKAIIDETIPLCQSRFTQAGVMLKLGTVDESLRINCRSTEISQIILNLLGNAFDAVESYKEKWVQLDVVEYNQFFDIRVTDSGTGIPKDIQQKMLQPFFTTKPVGKGTGLGLSISMGIAKAHQGSLFIDQECKNTCFVLRLPKVA